MKKRRFHDDEERTLITAYERGEFKPVKDQKGAKRTAVETAKRYTRKDRLKEKREEILRIAAKYGAHNVRVFGSVARGEADQRSDIDLLVEFEPSRSLLDHAGLWLELQEALGCHVDVVSDRGIKARIRERVLREAVPI